MKTQSGGRVCQTMGVSMDPQFKRKLMERIESLKPFVPTISNYFQRLAALEMEQGLLGPVGKRVLLAGR